MPFAKLPSEVMVASNAGAYAEPMAEHVLAMTLALAKRLSVEHEKMRRGEFDQSTLNRSLRGATCTILGFGGIGRATARLMRAFGMRIQVINRTAARARSLRSSWARSTTWSPCCAPRTW